MPNILVVDDESNLRQVIGGVLRRAGYDVVEAGGVVAARAALRSGVFDLVVTDQKMPDGEGLDLLADCREADLSLPVVLLTAFATVELAVEAMRRGAFDVIPKPFLPEQVRAVVDRALEHTELSSAKTPCCARQLYGRASPIWSAIARRCENCARPWRALDRPVPRC